MLNKIGFVQTTQKMTGEIKSLTALRFIAAFYVSTYHLHYFYKTDMGWFNVFLSNGYLAVDFFFILSGFILTHTYFTAFTAGSFSARSFIIKRLARIYPVHIVTLFIMVLIFYIMEMVGIERNEGSSGVYEILCNLLLIHAWGVLDYYSYNLPSWSISAEFFAYLIFPFLFFFFYRLKAGEGLFLSICAFLVCFGIMYFQLGVILTEFHSYLSLIRITIEFSVGIGLYLFVLSSVSLVIRFRYLYLNIIALFVALNISGADYIVVMLFVSLIYLFTKLDQQGVTNFLHNGFLNYLGRVSYSFYMLHYVVLIGFSSLFLEQYMQLNNANLTNYELFLYLVLTKIVIFPCAMLMYHGVEVPMRRLIICKFIGAKSTGHIVD